MDERRRSSFSVADFLTWAEPRDERCELVEGQIVMQAGVSRDHERVAKRLFAALDRQVDAERFDVNKGDFGVRVGSAAGRGSVFYPDVVVDEQSENGDERVTTTARLVAEVLSPSTDLHHHVRKLERYKRLDTLVVYLVLDQKTPVVRVWRKGAGGWPEAPAVVEGFGSSLELPEVGATVRLDDVYRKPAVAQP